ncbi:unnamed protein product [Arctogadus glacialis]
MGFPGMSMTLTELLKQPGEGGGPDGHGGHHPIGTNGISARTLRSKNDQLVDISAARRKQFAFTIRCLRYPSDEPSVLEISRPGLHFKSRRRSHIPGGVGGWALVWSGL